jgi:hypothetical protein
LSNKFLILRRTEPIVIKMGIGLQVKYPLSWSDVNETWNGLGRFSKNNHISNIRFFEYLYSGGLYHACGRTVKQTDRQT